jgi:hypothetical protein
MRLELQVQALVACGEKLARQWRHLHERRAALGNRLPRVASQIVLSGLIGICQLRQKGSLLNERALITQEEYLCWLLDLSVPA